jgi:hypothetical protein
MHHHFAPAPLALEISQGMATSRPAAAAWVVAAVRTEPVRVPAGKHEEFRSSWQPAGAQTS